MDYNVEELRSKVSAYYTWASDMKKNLCNLMIAKLTEAKVGVRFGKEELVLSVKPKGYIVNDIVAVKVGMCRGNHIILYRTKNRSYDDAPRGNYEIPTYMFPQPGVCLSAYIDFYEAIVETLK